ncbi:MAG: hypothetical protein LBC75_09360 [Fibromonadaceae bacterium]|nr:hypothetical protein [Fibromonadaceae bacterium]
MSETLDLNELLGKLRECLDPYCDEYNRTTMEQKIDILQNISWKINMRKALLDYKEHYEHRNEPANPLYVLPNGLADIIDYLLKENSKLRIERKDLISRKEGLERIIKRNVKNVKYSGLNDFYCTPENLKTSELCLTAVKKDWRNLEAVPENLRTTEMCLAAVLQSDDALGSIMSLNLVPKDLITPEFCKAFVTSCGDALSRVPENLKTVELCFEACKAYPYNRNWVPESMRLEVEKLLVKGK